MIYDQLMQIYSSKAEVQFLCRVVYGRARAQGSPYAAVLFDGLIPRPHTRLFDSIFYLNKITHTYIRHGHLLTS